MALAWVVGAIGVAAGVYGCVLLASNPRSAPRATASTPRVAPPAGRDDVITAAADGLAVVRRLASGVAPDDTEEVRDALARCAQRFRTLREDAGDRDLARLLDIAANGAEIEATRLSGVAVMHGDRRAFLAALRTLRDGTNATRPTVSAVGATSASADVAPSFTVA